MYSHEERMTAIKCLIQNRFNYTTTIMELGYPTSTQALRNWFNEYKANGGLHDKDDTQRKYLKPIILAKGIMPMYTLANRRRSRQ